MAVIENLTKLMMFTLVCGSNGEGTPSPPPSIPTSCLLLVIEDEKGFFFPPPLWSYFTPLIHIDTVPPDDEQHVNLQSCRFALKPGGGEREGNNLISMLHLRYLLDERPPRFQIGWKLLQQHVCS